MVVERICTSLSTPSTLWYMCWLFGSDTIELIQLDCSFSPPRIKATTEISRFPRRLCTDKRTEDMCFMNNGDKALVVVSTKLAGLTAYNTETGQVEWKLNGCFKDETFHPVASPWPNVKGNWFTGVAVDGRGHIFVSDVLNLCIHVLDSSGTHLLSLDERYCRNCPILKKVQWCEKTSSLVVACQFPGRSMCSKLTYIKVKQGKVRVILFSI